MPAARLPVDIHVLDPALWDFGGPPGHATEGAAACDLVALSVFFRRADGKPDIKAGPRPFGDVLVLEPGCIAYVGVGFSMHIGDSGYAAHVIPRSSSAAVGIALANTVGLIDSDYTGPVVVALWNRNAPPPPFGGGFAWPDEEPRGNVAVRRGERIAQMYLAPIVRPVWNVCDSVGGRTARGAGGFGSTGRG